MKIETYYCDACKKKTAKGKLYYMNVFRKVIKDNKRGSVGCKEICISCYDNLFKGKK